MDSNRPQTFDEAISAINDAMIAQGASLKDLLQSDYSNLRNAVEDLVPRVAQQFRDTTAPYVEKAHKKAREVAGPQIDFAVAGSKTVANEFDRQVKQNPYLVLGGIALGACVLGYLYGRSKTPPPADHTTDYTADYNGLSYGDVPVASQSTDYNVELA